MDEYGNEIEIFYDDLGNVEGMELITPTGKSYVYGVEEMAGSVNLLSLLAADGVDLEKTVYAQDEEVDYSYLSDEEKEYIRRNF